MDNISLLINKIVSIIVSRASPDQILLFGSYANGRYTDKSDIDLLIIKKNLLNDRDLVNALYDEFYESDINKPVDLLAIDSDTFREVSDDIGYIYKSIKEEGVVLYGEL